MRIFFFLQLRLQVQVGQLLLEENSKPYLQFARVVDEQEVRLQRHSLYSHLHPVGERIQFPVNPPMVPSSQLRVLDPVGAGPQSDEEQAIFKKKNKMNKNKKK